jgi:hypothetical protein
MNNDNFTYSIAVHESGHAVAGAHFKIPAYPEITPNGESRVTGAVDPKHAGLCYLGDGRDGRPITKFQHAAFCWAGPMSECLYGHPSSWQPPFKPSRLMLRDWHGMMMQQIKRFSEGDQSGILAYKDTWRSCKSAFQIVTKNRVRIIRLAKAIAGRIEKPVPLPESFPAPLSDFLRLVVATDGTGEPEVRFRAYLFDRTQRSFADGQFRFDSPEQQQDAIEKWSAARLAKYQAGFSTADEWCSLARAFRAWTKNNKSTDQSK